MFIITPPWAYQRSYTTNRNTLGEEVNSNHSDVVVFLEDPEVGNGGPSHFVVLNTLTLLGHEARPCSPLSLLLGVQETRLVLAIILNSNFFEIWVCYILMVTIVSSSSLYFVKYGSDGLFYCKNSPRYVCVFLLYIFFYITTDCDYVKFFYFHQAFFLNHIPLISQE